ncbi:MAG: hypothetical protein IJS69_06155, partial [Selenomonadaceae bacterium]|nr:hypothetical protein [Selenomonadaceae bacterium]
MRFEDNDVGERVLFEEACVVVVSLRRSSLMIFRFMNLLFFCWSKRKVSKRKRPLTGKDASMRL